MLQVNSRGDVSGGTVGDGSFDENLVLSYGCRVATTSDQTVDSSSGAGFIVWHTDSNATYGCYDNGDCWDSGDPVKFYVPSGVPDGTWVLFYYNIIKDHSSYVFNNGRAHLCGSSVTPIKFHYSILYPVGFHANLPRWGRGTFSSEYTTSHTVYAGSTAGFVVLRGSLTP